MRDRQETAGHHQGKVEDLNGTQVILHDLRAEVEVQMEEKREVAHPPRPEVEVQVKTEVDHLVEIVADQQPKTEVAVLVQ